jgi:hypothetical protein
MLPEEQTLLSGLFQRVRAADATPRDREAEALIADAVRAQPSAPYYLAQAVIIQEKGLEAAAKRIEELEAQLRADQEKIHALEAQAAQAPHESGGFLGSLFGSGEKPRQEAPSSYAGERPASPASAPQASGPWGAPRASAPQPQYQPQYQPQQGYQPQSAPAPWDRPQPSAGGGFLRGAMGTAAGVAGGMLLANSLSGIFGNHMSSLGLGGVTPAAAPIEETIVNNYYGDDAVTQASDPSPEPAPASDQDGWQQADLDTGGDDSFDSGFGSDDSMDV